jgi:hypothetical protein
MARSTTSNTGKDDLTLDTVLPEITVRSLADGLLTNRTAQTAAGRLSDPGLLTLNTEAGPVRENGAFSQSVALEDTVKWVDYCQGMCYRLDSYTLTLRVHLSHC